MREIEWVKERSSAYYYYIKYIKAHCPLNGWMNEAKKEIERERERERERKWKSKWYSIKQAADRCHDGDDEDDC